MAKNIHYYDRTEIVQQILPPGRYLKIGESIKKGDLWLDSSGPYMRTTCAGSKVYNNEENEYYRPHKVKYYFLKPTEIVQKGDEGYRKGTRGWMKANQAIGHTVKEWPHSATNPDPCVRWRRKLNVKKD